MSPDSPNNITFRDVDHTYIIDLYLCDYYQTALAGKVIGRVRPTVFALTFKATDL